MTRGNRDEEHPNRQVGADRYPTLGQFTSKSGRTEDRAISLRTYRNANLRRSITADPMRRKQGMRQMTGGELQGR